MKRALKAAGILFGLLLLFLVGTGIWFFSRFPDGGPVPTVTVEKTAARLERGRYLAHHVAVCIDCHSDRDWRMFSGPTVAGTEGAGGFKFGPELGFPGSIYAKNITPAGIGSMSDGRLLHTITTGVGKDGQALFPLMPYQAYAQLSDEDLYSIIAYIRTLKPVERDVPATQLDFPLNLIVRTIPAHRAVPKNAPDRSDTVAYGRYLATAAICTDCHSPREKGEIIPGREFGGGEEFHLPTGTVRSANLTPEIETGIGGWTKEIFIAKFRAFSGPGGAEPVGENGFQSVMPWTCFAGMTDEDLGAIYSYLMTLKPVWNRVEPWTPAATAAAVE
jgi:mono/diheme cytochrome c family protein